MTYKNIKFEDSPVMRSLEKLAINKGLVKPDVISKTASVKTSSLKPTENLEENILNLCSALRTSGFTKQAVEVETKFFNLKKADSLYNINGNTGEEEIGAAHPEGSHQMKDVDGDALVETVFDTQKAIQQMIAKKPTGKLAATLSAVNMIKAAGKTNKKAEAINALRIILAEDTASLVQNKIMEAQNQANIVLKIIKEQNGPEDLGAKNMGRISAVAPLLNAINSMKSHPDIDHLKEVKRVLQFAVNSLSYVDPTTLDKDQKGSDRQHTFAITSYPAWQSMQAAFLAIVNALNDISKLSQGDGEFITKIDKLITTLESYKALLLDEGFTPQDRKDGNAEIQGFIHTLINWKTMFSKIDPSQREMEAKRYEAKFTALSQQVAQLYSEITAQ